MNKLCVCGCGIEVSNSRARFLKGHGNRGLKRTIEVKSKLSKIHLNKPSSFKGKIHSNLSKLKMSNSHIGKSSGAKGTNLSENHKKRLREFNTGKKMSLEAKLNMSNNCKLGITGMSGRHHSFEAKVKMSISAIKHLEKTIFSGGSMYPNIGNNEIPILDQIEKSIKLEIDRNSRKLAGVTGKFNDGFIHKYNLGLDILEDHHFKVNGELSDNDQDRQVIIAWKLGCMIYYIEEQEFLKNSEIEIQRLKDFLLLLDQGKN